MQKYIYFFLSKNVKQISNKKKLNVSKQNFKQFQTNLKKSQRFSKTNLKHVQTKSPTISKQKNMKTT